MSNPEHPFQPGEQSAHDAEGREDRSTTGPSSDTVSAPSREAASGRTTRRRVVNALIGGGLIGWLSSIIYPVFSFLKAPEVDESNVNSIRAGLASEFQNNTSQIVKFGRTPVLLVRLQSGEFRALSATCTHLECIVQFRSDLQLIWCACHNGEYDLNGRNVSGPPPRPLQVFNVNVMNDEIVISKPAQVA